MNLVRVAAAIIMALALVPPAAANDWAAGDRAFALGKFDKVMELTLPLAEAGDVDAQNRLAHLFRYGEGTVIDYERAAYWSQRAADQGSGYAMTVLWSFYKDGLGVPKDEERAQALLEQAAEHGDELANYNLYASARRNGDTELARAYLDTAIALEGADAQFTLGRLHFSGDMGFEQDYEKARAWMELAAAQRHIEALVFSSMLASHTDWIDQPDYPLSALYMRIALHEGCLGVGKQLNLVLSILPIEDLMQSDQRLTEWLDNNPPPEPHRHRAPPDVCEIIVE